MASIFWILRRMSWRSWPSSPTFVRASPGCIPTRRSSATTSFLRSKRGHHFWLCRLDPKEPGEGDISGGRPEGEVGRVAELVVLDRGEGSTGVLPGSPEPADSRRGLERQRREALDRHHQDPLAHPGRAHPQNDRGGLHPPPNRSSA